VLSNLFAWPLQVGRDGDAGAFTVLFLGAGFKSLELLPSRACKPDLAKIFVNGQPIVMSFDMVNINIRGGVNMCTIKKKFKKLVIPGSTPRLTYAKEHPQLVDKGQYYQLRFRVEDGGDGRAETKMYIGAKQVTLGDL
jgi:hypothetical protein